MIPAHIFCSQCGTRNDRTATFCFSCGRQLAHTTSATGTIQNVPTPSTLLPSSTVKGQPPIISAATPPNTILKQRYRVLQPVGKGGMGAVYKGEDTQLGNRLVAIKEMSLSALSPEEREIAITHFKREAHLLAGLQHPNLPSIYDHFSESQRWYLVMSFIQGTTLQEHLTSAQGGKLPLEEVLHIGRELCTVLRYLHSYTPPIIFRDLKPANIMRDKNGHLYLIDFGIARLFKPGQQKDTASYVSFGYAPPEQYGQAQTTPRSDIYSLGATLYHLLSGYAPSQSPFRLPPLQSLVPALPPRLVALITRMLDLDVDRRPATMMAVKQELQAIAGSPATPSSITPPTSLARQETKHSGNKTPASATQSTPPPSQTPGGETVPALPRYGFLYALISGIIAGSLGYGVSLVFHFWPLLILWIILCCVAGFVTGKTARDRNMGWITGIASVLPFCAIGAMSGNYNIAVPIILLVTALPLVFCGSWLATRTYPVVSPANTIAKTPPLPRYRFLYAFISGIIAGPLIVGSILLSTSGVINSSNLILVPILGGIICCVAGFVTGKTAVARNMGWITGIVAGLSFCVTGLILLRSLLLLSPIFLLVILLFPLPFTFCGSWLATRTHPYYRNGAGS